MRQLLGEPVRFFHLNTLEVQDVVPLSPYVDVLLGSVTP